mgnify:CR=1 FL=1
MRRGESHERMVDKGRSLVLRTARWRVAEMPNETVNMSERATAGWLGWG